MSRRTKIIIAILLLAGLAVLLYFVFRSPEEAPKKVSKAQPAVEDAVSEAMCGCLELPAAVAEAEGEYVVTHRAEMGGTLQRNYTLHYDPDVYAALWVAYPLCSDHIATGREEAQTVGFWLPHDDLKGHSYADYAVSVDQIEEWTGLNLFHNLPDNLESHAETLSAWPSFKTY